MHSCKRLAAVAPGSMARCPDGMAAGAPSSASAVPASMLGMKIPVTSLSCSCGLVAAVGFGAAIGCNEKPSPAQQPSAPPAVAQSPPSAAATPTSTSASAAAPVASVAKGKAIGTAKMESDGTLVVTLYTPPPMRGQSQKSYLKGDPRQERYLKHVGGLAPGEEKLIPPFPDNIDDARVNASVKKHIAKHGWASGAKITITGTDARGRVAATAVDRGPPRKGVALRLDPKTYAVVEETPLP